MSCAIYRVLNIDVLTLECSACPCRYRDRGQYDSPPPHSSYKGAQPPTEDSSGSGGNNGNSNGSGNPNGGGGMDNFTKALIAGAFIMGMGTGMVMRMVRLMGYCCLAEAARPAKCCHIEAQSS